VGRDARPAKYRGGLYIDPETDQLVPLAGSTQNLPGGMTAAPAMVSFTPDGGVLVVTEKGTSRIDTFVLNGDGVAEPGVSFPSSGTTPFGFAFGHDEVLIVLRRPAVLPGHPPSLLMK
jgi:6-phosphogluconolactonase